MLFDRLKEPSSAAGLSGIIAAVPSLLANPYNAAAWGAIVAGLFAVFLPERGRRA